MLPQKMIKNFFAIAMAKFCEAKRRQLWIFLIFWARLWSAPPAPIRRELCAEEKALAAKHLTCPTRPQTISWRLLSFHAEYCKLYSEILIEKAMGRHFHAIELAKEFYDKMGAYEIAWERYYDHGLACRIIEHIISKPKKIIFD